MAVTFDTQTAINSIWGESITYEMTTGDCLSLTAGRHEAGESEGVTSYGVYTIRKEVFTLAYSPDGVDNFRPTLRDTISVDDEPDELVRVVTSVTGSKFLQFWKVETAYPALAADLDQTATVYRANAVSEGFGLRDPNAVPVYENVPCRLQPDKRTRNLDSAGRVVTEQSYVCVFGSSVTLNAGDTVTVNSVIYEVTEQSEIESLGVLTFAGCERID
jgi:hypothetical protein